MYCIMEIRFKLVQPFLFLRREIDGADPFCSPDRASDLAFRIVVQIAKGMLNEL